MPACVDVNIKDLSKHLSHELIYHNRRFSANARSFAMVGKETVSMPERILLVAVMLDTIAPSLFRSSGWRQGRF